MNIILCGLQNAGKSTLGALLSAALNWQFNDTDNMIEVFFKQKHQQALSVQRIYQTLGEHAFRKLESEIIHSCLRLQNAVIATGGGSFMDKCNADFLQKLGYIIYCHLSPDAFLQRLKNPAYFVNSKETARQLYLERTPQFQKYADHTIFTEKYPPSACLNQILTHLQEITDGQ